MSIAFPLLGLILRANPKRGTMFVEMLLLNAAASSNQFHFILNRGR
jgi:hypothetical protein